MLDKNGYTPLKPGLILIDVYDTILNMNEMERRVNDLLDSKRGYIIWFEMCMQYCFVDNLTGNFHDFHSIASSTMLMAAARLGRTINEHDVNEILSVMTYLPVHEEVQEGLSALRDLGYRIAALTNTPGTVVGDRMQRTGLISYFEEVLSAEQIKKYKPDISVYKWSAQKLNTPLQEVLMFSSHGWDITGAAHAGMQTAYKKQGRQLLYPLSPKPDIIVKNLTELALKLAEVKDPSFQ